MNAPDSDARASDASPAIDRVLLVADTAVAVIDELPSEARTLIDSAAELYVVTPALPRRLDWLAWQLNPARHAADERLNVMLSQLRSIGASARGKTGDDSILTAFADAIAEFKPDRIVIAMRSSEHANWQERGLTKRVKESFGLPLTSFAVDPQGHPAGRDRASA